MRFWVNEGRGRGVGLGVEVLFGFVRCVKLYGEMEV